MRIKLETKKKSNIFFSYILHILFYFSKEKKIKITTKIVLDKKHFKIHSLYIYHYRRNFVITRKKKQLCNVTIVSQTPIMKHFQHLQNAFRKLFNKLNKIPKNIFRKSIIH